MTDDTADTDTTVGRSNGTETGARTDTGTGSRMGTGAGTDGGSGSDSGAAFGSASPPDGPAGGDRSVFGDWPADGLAAAERAFRWLCTRPHPVAVDGRAVPGLPAAPVPLDELRARLLDPRTPAALGDQVWAHLIGRARVDGPSWTTACAGMAAPMLAGLVRSLTARIDGDPGEVRAEITSETLAGFLAALRTVDPDRAPLVSLRWAAYRAGHAAAVDAFNAPRPIPPRPIPSRTGGDGHGYDDRADRRFDGGGDGGFDGAGRVGHPRRGESGPPTAPGHPDLVLARAVADGALSVAEASLIGVTRLEPVTVAQAAAALGAPPATVWSRRSRGEARLIAYLTGDRPTADQTAGNQAAGNQTVRNQDTGNPAVDSRASGGAGATARTRRVDTDDAAQPSGRDAMRGPSTSTRRRRRTRRTTSTTPATASVTASVTAPATVSGPAAVPARASTTAPAGRRHAGSPTASAPPSGPASARPASGPASGPGSGPTPEPRPGSGSGTRPGSRTRTGGHAERGPEAGTR